MESRVILTILAFTVVSGSENYKNEGFMNHLNTGMKFAQNILGSESVALKVADFVVRAFHTAGGANTRRPVYSSYGDDYVPSQEQSPEDKRPVFDEHGAPPATPWRYLVHLLGLQPSQISAVAVNALVFVAQIISNFLAGPRRPVKPHRSDDPTDWILSKNSKKLQDIIATAKNESLPDLVEELVKEYGNQEDTSCIRLLVCKITPFVSRMQRAVFGEIDMNSFNREARGAAILYRHLPSKVEITERSTACEKRYQECDLNE